MSSPFDSLESSAERARELLEGAAETTFGAWPSVVRKWKRSKQALIDALDPTTGRRVVPFRQEVSDAEALKCWRESLRFGAASKASADQTERGRVRYALLVRFEAQAFLFSNKMYERDVQTVAPESYLLECKGVRAGQRFTRALAAYLRSEGATADEASSLVDAYSAAAQTAPRDGKIVLSANILDILTCSENAAYSSCHGFDGCHRAGPLAYACDACTLTAFYYEKEANNLPYKLMRQMVYIDRQRQSAALQRRYGAELPDAAYKAIRREVARLLTALDGGEASAEPKWVRCKPDGMPRPSNDGPAYLDSTVECVQLTAGHKYRPRITLVWAVCPDCGDTHNTPGNFMCDSCSGEGSETCVCCGERIDEDDARSEDDGYYCDSCWQEHFTSCVRCGCSLSTDNGDCNYIEDSGDYCERCYLRVTSDCPGCQGRFPDRELTDGYCGDCEPDYPECADCGERHHESETAEVGGDEICSDCASDRAKLAPLYHRLLSSPRFLRSGAGARCVLVRHWELKIRRGFVGWDWAYFAVLENHPIPELVNS